MNEKWSEITESYIAGYTDAVGRAPDDARIPWSELEPLAALDHGWAEQALECGRVDGQEVATRERSRRQKCNARARARYAAMRNLGLRRGPEGWE